MTPQFELTPFDKGWLSGRSATGVADQILGDVPGPISLTWVKECLRRIQNLRRELRSAWAGLNSRQGHLVDWLIAATIARENVLLLGPPGCAKSQIAKRFLELLRLTSPQVDQNVFHDIPYDNIQAAWKEWQKRSEAAREHQTYFHLLVSRFTQPDELFGPIDIGLLRQGVVARVNFGLLTGPGMWGAFLDEIFKSSSALVNTLLTLTQERQYFNWGGMQPADLVILIGASNEMPGGFASGTAHIGAAGDDFQTLYAFLDRFSIRLPVPLVTGGHPHDVMQSDLSNAFDIAVRREGSRFTSRHHFKQVTDTATLEPTEEMPGINDLLLAGRACLQHEASETFPCLFENRELDRFRTAFVGIGADLGEDATNPAVGRITWTISPRKLNALYKIALAYALVNADDFAVNPQMQVISDWGERSMRVFQLIWDSPIAEPDLHQRTDELISSYL